MGNILCGLTRDPTYVTPIQYWFHTILYVKVDAGGGKTKWLYRQLRSRRKEKFVSIVALDKLAKELPSPYAGRYIAYFVGPIVKSQVENP